LGVRIIRTIAVASGLALQLIVFFSILWEISPGQHLAAVFGLLVTGAVLVAAGLGYFGNQNPGLEFWLYLALSIFIPVYGAVGCLFVAWYRLLHHDKGQTVDDYTDYISLKNYEDTISSGSVDEMIHRELEIQSYIDIIRGPNLALKKALIGKIIDEYEWTPHAVELLKTALDDEEYEIRSYASTALSEVEDRINQHIRKLEENLGRDQENTTLKLKLARSYLDYVKLGLLDDGSADRYLKSAGNMLDDAEKVTSGDDRFRISILLQRGRAADLAGDSVAGKIIYEEILKEDPDNQQALAQLCSILFQEKEFPRLAETCDHLLGVVQSEHPAAVAARVWSSKYTITGE
jgi:tetratricopeptide (TPR) repeat protein